MLKINSCMVAYLGLLNKGFLCNDYPRSILGNYTVDSRPENVAHMRKETSLSETYNLTLLLD